MRVNRCHVEIPLSVGARVALPEGAAAHLLRVLRFGVGDACVLFNGDGRDYDARIAIADRRGAEVDIVDARIVATESPLRIVLVQGIARGEKMDWILQKATELGVAAFVPVHSERSEVKLDKERATRRHAHWRSVVTAACEQSWRARVPDVGSPRSLAAALQALPSGGVRITLDPDARDTLEGLSAPSTNPATSPTSDPSIVVAIGPEGGWSGGDRTLLAQAGFRGMRLGPRILRTETAGIAAIAVLQALRGDFGTA